MRSTDLSGSPGSDAPWMPPPKRAWDPRQATSLLPLLGLAAILTLGLYLRLELAGEYRDLELDPDVVMFRQIAHEMRGPLDSRHIGPPYIWLIKGVTWVWGNAPDVVRRLSVGASILVVGITYVLGAALYGRGVGLVAAGLLAVNRELVFQSVRGLREEVSTALLLGLLVTLFAVPRAKGVSRWVTAGLLGGGLALIRFTGVLPAVALLADRALVDITAERRGWRATVARAAAGGLVGLGLVTPYLAYSAREFGDPFYSVNVHAKSHRNMEFAGRPGFPSREAIVQNVFTGSDVTAFEYVFGLHTPREVARRYGDGALWVWRFWSSRLGSLVTVAAALGLVRLALGRGHVLLVAVATATFPFLFGLTVMPDEGRFIIPTFPLLALSAAWVLVRSASRAREWLGARLVRLGAASPGRTVAAAIPGVALAVVLGLYGYQELWPPEDAYNEAIRRLAVHVKERAPGLSSERPYRIAVCSKIVSSDYFFPGNFALIENAREADFVLAARGACSRRIPGPVVVRVRRLGVSLVRVKEVSGRP